MLAATLARVEANWTGTISSDSFTADDWTAGVPTKRNAHNHTVVQGPG
jgi:hypothetical protein